MATAIISNGSKWAGEAPDTIDQLIEVLAKEPLDPAFENCGGFIDPECPITRVTRFFGNFARLSHGFQINSDDETVIARLAGAIRANQESEAYRALRAGYPMYEG